jgi:hypothetical protein
MACAKRADVVKYLADKYRENRVAMGVGAGNSQMFELFVSPAGTWTLLMSPPSGPMACIWAAGDGWQANAGAAGPKGPGL